MEIQLRDTQSRTIAPLPKPKSGDPFRYYCCGPTVYGPAHIGNFRSFVIQDVLRRLLEIQEYNPFHVRNITDVDDKTIRRSQEESLPLSLFTEKWTKRFHTDCKTLNIITPHKEPKATEHIDAQIQLIDKLIKKGHAYMATDGSVYYKVSSFSEYGKLSHLDKRNIATQATNSAGEANDADEYDRECINDFALWKARKPEDGPNFWNSPWGEGRPGWHIECSAMAMAYLGETLDLHGGGIDLCFPHHENEIAQAEAATGRPFTRHWFHIAHLMVEGQKMSKSLGNLYTVNDIQEKGYSPMALRYCLISGHYHQPFNFTFDGLNAARSALEKLSKFAYQLMTLSQTETAIFNTWCNTHVSDISWGPFSKSWYALAQDLNIPSALGEVFTSIKQISINSLSAVEAADILKSLARVLYALGLNLDIQSKASVTVPEEVQLIAQKRWDAKKNKDFKTADSLRSELEKLGWKVLDNKDGFEVEKI